VRATTLRLGDRVYDIEHRPLVMGILNRTPDSFYDKGVTFALDDLVRRAGILVDQGADLLDVGGVKAGPGPEVTEEEELDRVVPAIAALADRFDVPLSVDTWRASVARAAYGAGAVVGNDISGFADPDYLPAAAEHRATVVATHIRLGPRIPDPDPVYDDVVGDVATFLVERAGRARAAGIAPDRIVIDAGLDLGKTALQSLALLRASDRLADLGFPVLLSASNKTFLGVVLGLEIGERREASIAATSLGAVLGCRVMRVHEVGAHRQACDVLAAVAGARR
jgi:dihydropteroate synthase